MMESKKPKLIPMVIIGIELREEVGILLAQTKMRLNLGIKPINNCFL